MKLNQKENADLLASFEAFKVESKKVRGGYTEWGAKRLDVNGDTWQMCYEYDDDTCDLIESCDTKTGTDDRG